MIKHGNRFLDYATLTQDVEGQIARRRLRHRHIERIQALLPAVEAAMTRHGVAYEHCALGGVASGQLSIVRIHGRLHRLGFYKGMGRDPVFAMDTTWCDDHGNSSGLAAGKGLLETMDIGEDVGEAEIDGFIARYVEKAVRLDYGHRPGRPGEQ